MKTMNYSLIRILFALVIGLVLVLWPNTAASYIVITIGVAFLIPGVISLFSFFGRKRSEHEPAPPVFLLRESAVCYSDFG